MSSRSEQNKQSQEMKEKKISFQNYIKRMIFGFFTIMIALTFLSRAADSALVAKVTVTSAKKGELEFMVQGSGIITDHAKQYLDIYDGIHIEQLLVEVGQKVEAGDALFQYNIEDLKEKLEEANKEVKRAELEFKKNEPSYEMLTVETSEDAEISLKRAEQDLATAKQDLQMAKEKVNKQRQKNYEDALKSYEAAVEEYNRQEDKKNRAINKANRTLQETKEARTDLNEERTKAETVLSEYKVVVESLSEPAEDVVSSISEKKDEPVNYSYIISNIDNKFFRILNNLLMNDGAMQIAPNQTNKQEQNTIKTDLNTSLQEEIERVTTAVENIFKNYYGDKEYEAHRKEVEEAAKNFERKKEDYSCSILNAMNLTIEDKMNYVRMYEDAEDALKTLTSEDSKINEAIMAYGNALLNKNSTEIENTYKELFTLIYQESDMLTKEIKAADNAIIYAEEDFSETTADWNDVMKKDMEQVEELMRVYQQEGEVCEQIAKGTFDYTEDVRLEEKQVEDAARNLSDAKDNLEKAKKKEKETSKQKEREDEIQKLDYELYQSDLDEKKKSVEKLELLLEKKGIVTSPVTGYAADMGIMAGCITTGSEIVAIAANECIFQTFLTKEEAKHIEVGDEVRVLMGNRDMEMVVPITSIGEDFTKGKIEITGIMPEGTYVMGTEVSYKITKKSKKYHQIIPINALHSDSHGNYYVLVPEEQNTVLGNELVARKIAITLIDKDYTTAAIEGNLYSVDIISGSNKNIEEGDRVRIIVEE